MQLSSNAHQSYRDMVAQTSPLTCRMQSWQQRWRPQPESVKAEQDLDPLLESAVPQGDSRLSTASSQSSLHAS